MESEILKLSEVAKILRVCPTTINRMAQRGEIPAFKIGNRWRFEKEKILAHLTKRELHGQEVY